MGAQGSPGPDTPYAQAEPFKLLLPLPNPQPPFHVDPIRADVPTSQDPHLDLSQGGCHDRLSRPHLLFPT